jgi:uncharacterized protein YybS (DUF2232 family)
MIALARIADRGPLAAAAVAAGLLMCALWIPVLIALSTDSPALVVPGFSLSMVCLLASAAVVAFVALRHGELSALKVSGGCLLLLAVVSLLVSGSAQHIPQAAVIFWLPAIVAAFVLARTVKLEWAVLMVLVVGLIAVFAFVVFAGDTEELLRKQFEAVHNSTLEDSDSPNKTGALVLNEEQQNNVVTSLARTIPGGFGIMVMSFALGALFLARSWQAGLVNPGGFQKEFHGLKFSRQVCFAGVLLVVLASLYGGKLGIAVSMIIIFGLFLQGLAVAHALVKQRSMHRYWLHGLYVMVFMLPHTFLLLAALGLADNLFSLRGAQTNNG